MGSAVRSRTLVATRAVPGASLGDAGAWLLGFALVAYLAFSGGGYDPVVRGEIGVATWWLVLVGVAAGVLRLRWGVAGWTAAGLLAGYTLLTGLAVGWTTSDEATVGEIGRAATHLGVLALGLCALAGRSVRPVMNGLACAFGLVAVMAALSRLQPQWFPENDHATLLAEAAHRLSYPLNYWNGLAAFLAMGTPVLLAVAAGARSRIGQAAAAAAVPFGVLALSLTASRGGVLALVLAVLALAALAGDRLSLVPALLTGAAGSAIMLAALEQRETLKEVGVGAASRAQGDEMLVIACLVAAGCGLLQVAGGLVARHAARPRWTVVPPRRALALTAAGVVAAFAVAVAAGVPGALSDRWEEFKSPANALSSANEGRPVPDLYDRLDTASGNGRYQVWDSALDAMRTDPLKGIGPGTFEYWWLRDATIPSYLRDAHSLVFETLAELGVPGLLLIAGLLLLMLAGGVVRTLRADPDARLRLAAATAAIAAFVLSASIDWSWELFVLPATALLLAAVVLTGSRSDWRDDAPAARPVIGPRAAFAAAALVALVAVAIPLAGASAVRDSQASVREGDLGHALAEARTAARTQPYAGTPLLQEALIHELAGDLPRAREAVVAAAAKEPRNWRIWVVRSRLEARAGDADAALRSFRRARDLNPRSPLLRP